MPRDLSTALWHKGRFWVIFEPRDFWLGLHVAPAAVYVCVVPCLAVKWERRPSRGRWALLAAYAIALGACFFPVAMAAVIGVVLVLAGVR